MKGVPVNLYPAKGSFQIGRAQTGAQVMSNICYARRMLCKMGGFSMWCVLATLAGDA